MGKVIWHKTASPPQTDGSIVFARWHQCAFHVGIIGVTWQIRLNLYFLRPTPVHNPNGKSTRSTVLAQLTAESPYTYNWLCFPQNCPLPFWIWTPSNTWFPGPTRVLNPHLDRFSRFCIDNRRVSLYLGWQWRNFFISYLCQLFFRHFMGQALRHVSYSDITFLVR